MQDLDSLEKRIQQQVGKVAVPKKMVLGLCRVVFVVLVAGKMDEWWRDSDVARVLESKPLITRAMKTGCSVGKKRHRISSAASPRPFGSYVIPSRCVYADSYPHRYQCLLD